MPSDEVLFHQIIQREAALDRDRELVAFLRDRISERSGTATAEERALLAAVGRVLAQFADTFEGAARTDPTNQEGGWRAGQAEALGWTLRCVAFAAFAEHPDFQPTWRP